MAYFNKSIIYELVVSILAVVSVVFAFCDIAGRTNSAMNIVDVVIYVFFVVDYFTRLLLSDNKKFFVKENVLDLIAILPFNSALRLFRAAKIIRLLKLSKLARLLARSGRILSRCRRFMNTNGFKYILIVSCILVIVGGVLISLTEHMSISDGMWWAFVTATTVGYGDISPSSGAGRLIACVLMLCGIGLIGSLTSTITSYFMNAQNKNESIDNDKVRMALVVWEQLSDSEKSEFKNHIE